MSKHGGQTTSGEDSEVVIGYQTVHNRALTSCLWQSPGVPPEIESRGNLNTEGWDESLDEWRGTGFLGGARDLQQLGDCDTQCQDEGWPQLWSASRERWEGANQTRQVSLKLDEIDGSNFDTSKCEDEGHPNPVGCREKREKALIEDAGGDPLASDWEVLDFRFRTRFGIDISHWRANAPEPNIANRTFCDDAGAITFTGSDSLGKADSIMMLVDRSGSMNEPYSHKNEAKSKMEYARPGVDAFLHFANDSGTRAGVRVFARTSELVFSPRKIVTAYSDPLVTYPDGDEITIEEATDKVEQALSKFESKTTIGRTLVEGVVDLVDSPNVGNHKAIFLITDGRQSSGILSCEDGVQVAVDNDVEIYWAPIGEYPSDGCPDWGFPNTEVFEMGDSEVLPTRMLEVFAKFRGTDLSAPTQPSSVAHAIGGLPQEETFQYVVSSDASRFIVEFTNVGEDILAWEPIFELKQPDDLIYTEVDDVFSVDKRNHVGIIDLPSPQAGTWELKVKAPGYSKLTSEDTLISTMVEKRGARCDLDISQHDVRLGGAVKIHAVASFDGSPIHGEGLSITGTVTNQRVGTQTPITFEVSEEGLGTATFDAFEGDSIYDLQVVCQVGAGAAYVPGEGADEELPLPPSFELAPRRGFRLMTGEYYIPTLSADCDSDGYTNGEEGVAFPGTPLLDGTAMVDTDGDGSPDACDDDSDNDGVLDVNETDEDTDGDGFDNRVDVDSDDDGDMDGDDPFPEDDDLDRSYAEGDFDGDGIQDRIIGDETYNTSSGRIAVYYGSDDDYTPDYVSRDTGLIQGSETNYDRFGQAVAAGDFDGDGYDDIVVGAPYDDLNGSTNGGSIHIIYGSSTGLVTTGGDQLLHQDSPSISGVVEAYDYYGERLETGDYNCDGYDDVVVGVPRENLSNGDSGVVAVIYGSSTGLSTTDNEWYQGSNGVDGIAEAYDRFGDTLKTGEFDGNDCSDLAIGVPREDLNSTSNAGYVYVMRGGLAGIHPNNGDFGFFQSTTGIPGSPEASDYMGRRFWTGDFDGDGYGDLATLVEGDGCGAGTKGFLITYGAEYAAMTSTGAELHCLSAYQEYSW